MEDWAPGWQILFARLWKGAERFLPKEKIILIDEDVPDPDHAVVHAAAHVWLGHLDRPGPGFGDDQEHQSDLAADLRLDRVDWAEAS